MKLIILTFLIAIVTADIFDKAKDIVEKAKDIAEDVAEKAEEKAKDLGEDISEKAKDLGEDISEKAKDLGEDISEKAKDLGEDISEKTKDLGEDISEKAKEIAEGVSEKTKEMYKDISKKAKEISKNIIEFFKLGGTDIKERFIWLKEKGYLDEILPIVEAIVKDVAIIACKSYLVNAQNLCEPLVQVIFEAVKSLIIKTITNFEETEYKFNNKLLK